MKKLLIPIAVIACASIAVLCTACQQENTESEATTAPSITIIATADESTKDETATMPKITEETATGTTSRARATATGYLLWNYLFFFMCSIMLTGTFL